MTAGAIFDPALALAEMGLGPEVVEAMMQDAWKAVEQQFKLAESLTDYRPRGAAKELQTAEDPEIVIDGPAGTGKTRACLERVHRLLVQHPGSRALMVRKTRKSLSESGMFTYEQHVLRPSNPLVANGPSRTHRDKYVYPNGSEFVMGGLDNIDKVLGSEYDIVYVPQAEEMSQDDRDALNSRLRNGVMPFQQLLMDTNPSFPTHWINELAIKGVFRMLKSQHQDNRRLWNSTKGDWTRYGRAYMERLWRLTGVRFKRLVQGLWVKAEGAVYEEWDRYRHLIPPFAIPRTWPRYLVIDFGFRNPFCAQWWAKSPDNRLYRYREMYGVERLVEDWCVDIRAASKGEKFIKVICDHDAEDRATLEKHLGVRTTAAYKPISRGIQAVQARLRPDQTGKAALYLFQGVSEYRDEKLREEHLPESTEEEIESYVWKTSLSGKQQKEEPVDENNHGLDCMRYVVAQLDLRRKVSGGRHHSHTRSNY